MLITEQSLMRACRTFVAQAHIPQPELWNAQRDKAFVKNRLFPAMLAALQEIENVSTCFGFDLDRASSEYCKGKDMPSI